MPINPNDTSNAPQGDLETTGKMPPVTGNRSGNQRQGARHSAAPSRKRKGGAGKKVAIGALVVLLLVIAGIGGFAWSYYNQLKSSLELKGDDAEQIKANLTETDNVDPFYVLVIGSDNWEDYGARSDAIMLCRVDLSKPQVTIVSVPRDTPYQIDGEKVKLNEAYARGGASACVKAVKKLTGVKINHYVEVEFEQLADVVEELGGVTVDVPYSIDYTVYTHDQDTVHLDAGPQELDGEQAIAFARMRQAYLNTTDLGEDAVRQANIRAMLVGIIKTVLDSPVNEIPGKVRTVADLISTDIPMGDIVDWARSIAGKDVTLYSCTGPAAGSLDEESGLWLTKEAPEQWAALMAVVDAGEDPSTVTGHVTTKDGKVVLDSTDVVHGGSEEQGSSE